MQLWEKYTEKEIIEKYNNSKTAKEFFNYLGYKNYDSRIKDRISNKYSACDFKKFTQGKFQDLTGLTFNYLTVLSLSDKTDSSHNSYWNCKCACGKTLTEPVAGFNLKNGKVKSCGCKKGELRINTMNQSLIGQTFGQLTVINYLGKSYWECLCTCGNKIQVRGDHLKALETTHCGCNKKLSTLRKDISNQIFGYLKALNINEDLTKNKQGTYWNCLCLNCGKTTTARLDWLIEGRKISCGCIISYKEEEIANYLKQNFINYKRQYTFEDLKDKRPLRFDFAVFNNKNQLAYLIEYQGEQHFTAIEAWGGEAELKNIQRRDKIKVDYCNNHKIPLIILDKNSKIENCIQQDLLK